MAIKYDIIVIGAGPAGLTAAIYLARSRVKTLVIDTGTVGGQMNLTYEVANYPGVLTATGVSIAQNMKKQAVFFGAKIISQATVTNFDFSSEIKKVTVEDEGDYEASAIIIATGGKPRTLGIESELRFQGKGISYCATCDGDFFTGKDIVVIGGGNSAIEESVSLTKYVNSVTIIHEFNHFQAHTWAVEEAKKNPKISFLLNQKVVDFLGSESLEGVVSIDKETNKETVTKVNGAFLFIGYVPNTSWLNGVINISNRQEIITDENLQTNLPGVFAAGDVRQKRFRQITTSVSDGTIAALIATEYLQNKKQS